ncbi:MAG: PEP/pyruvate-binding domain-containing protein [Chloroflexi bacterium]|nr:PEP/pyruvate-binding domain-containing protein [Chloroflexota bacterium]
MFLDHPWSSDASRVGGKGSSLGRLAEEFTVPPAFNLTTEAFDRWGEARHGSPDAPKAELPDGFCDAITEAYTRLASMCGTERPAVAVRSSAIDEDGAESSFAGQHDTYLNIQGADAVVSAIIRCWASLDSDVALDYRRQSGLPIEGRQMAVVVQQMVPADVSGVAFSANPVTGALGEVVINSSWGLGESVVSGTVTPDTYIVEKSGSRVISSDIAEKAVMTVSKGDGTAEVDVPRIMRAQPSMSDETAREVARLAVALERRMGHPVDIEWAVYDKTVYLLQCRPITTLD